MKPCFLPTLPAALALVLLGSMSSPMASPAADPPILPPKLPFEKFTLSNGLEVILHQDRSTPLVAVNLWYHVGSKNETLGKTGFAHLFEHMMFQGSKHHDTDYFEALEPIGATALNGTTNSDRTNYFQNVPPGALELTLWLEADRMGWLLPAMTQERFDNQREVVKNERRQGVDNQPYGRVDERTYAALYPTHHPYSWDVIGHMEDLTRASRDDVEVFFKTYYGPQNCTLVIGGDLDPRKTRELVERYFGSIPPGPPVARMEEWVPELSREVRLSMEDRVPLPRLYLRWHSPPSFKAGDADLDVLAGILSSGKNSRLYRRLVYDLQVAQDVSASQEGREITGLFHVVATARDGRTLDEIEPLVLEEVEKLKSSPPSAEEVARVQTGILAGFTRRLERLGGFGGRSDRLAMYNTYLGDPGWLEKDFDRYRAVTPASVQAAARRWLHQGRVTMRVTPFPNLSASGEVAGLDRSKKPAVAEPKPPQLPRLEKATLSNGLQVILAEAHEVPLVELSLLVRGGWSADLKEKPGVASFTARMQDEGTRRRSALQISEEAQRLGANLSASSNLDASRVSLNALKDRLKPSLDLWADVVLNPTFPEEELERQRREVLGQILKEKRQPVSMAYRILPGLLYGIEHPYGQPLTGSGSEASVKSISREDLTGFHSTWFKPGNATLLVVGDVTLPEVLPLLEKALGGWRAGPVPEIAIPSRPQPERTTVYLMDKPGAAQSVLLIGHLFPPRNDPDSVPFEVLNTVLGGQFTSRINMNLREAKGYSYGASSSTVDARGQGVFLASSQVRTDVTRESIVEMLRELRDIRESRPVTPQELEKAKAHLTLSLPGQYETLSGILRKIAEVVTYGLPEDYHSTFPERVRSATVEALTALARNRILPERMVVVVVGDRAVIEAGIRELNLGSIEYLDQDGRPIRES